MTWFRVDDGFPEHPKLVGLEDDPRAWAEAVSLWLAAGCYCARHLTDGRIPRAALRRVVPFAPKRAAEALVTAGLWRVDGDAYVFHDWSEYQPSRAEVEEKRERQREGGRRGAASRWGRDGSSHGSSHGSTHSDPHGYSDGLSPSSLNGPGPARPGPIDHVLDSVVSNHTGDRRGSPRPPNGHALVDADAKGETREEQRRREEADFEAERKRVGQAAAEVLERIRAAKEQGRG